MDLWGIERAFGKASCGWSWLDALLSSGSFSPSRGGSKLEAWGGDDKIVWSTLFNNLLCGQAMKKRPMPGISLPQIEVSNLSLILVLSGRP